MSSTYSPICLSHDPGIILGPDLTYDEANGLSSRDRLDGHESCDIVIGRFSYPLVEVACLGDQLRWPIGCKGHHGVPQWIDRDWLRLLFAATTPPNAVHPEVLRPLVRGCWPLDRLYRLRAELGLPESPTPAGPPQTCAATWTTGTLGVIRCAQPAGHYDDGRGNKHLGYRPGVASRHAACEWTDDDGGTIPHTPLADDA